MWSWEWREGNLHLVHSHTTGSENHPGFTGHIIPLEAAWHSSFQLLRQTFPSKTKNIPVPE